MSCTKLTDCRELYASRSVTSVNDSSNELNCKQSVENFRRRYFLCFLLFYSHQKKLSFTCFPTFDTLVLHTN